MCVIDVCILTTEKLSEKLKFKFLRIYCTLRFC